MIKSTLKEINFVTFFYVFQYNSDCAILEIHGNRQKQWMTRQKIIDLSLVRADVTLSTQRRRTAARFDWLQAKFNQKNEHKCL